MRIKYPKPHSIYAVLTILKLVIMKEFIPTENNLRAIEIFELAGYKIVMGVTVHGDNTVTFRIYEGEALRENLKYGCSSTGMLSPVFAINTIKEHAYKKGFDKGVLRMQSDFKKLIGMAD